MSRGTVNKAIIIGRLGRDPEMRYTASGTAVANFSVATNHSMRDASGNYEDQTEWHKVAVFGKQAEFAGEYLVKGKLVYVEGRIQTRSWEDREGQKRYTTEIIANQIQLMGGKSDGEGGSAAPAKAEPKPQKSSVSEPDPPAEEEDDLPF